MVIVLDKSTHEEHFSEILQTNNEQFKIAVTFLTGYNGIFNVINSNKNFYFMKSISDRYGIIQITIPPGAYEIEALDNEIKRNFNDESHYSKNDYPFKIKPKISNLGSIIEISPQGPIISFMFDHSLRNLLGLNAKTLYEDYNLSPNPLDM